MNKKAVIMQQLVPILIAIFVILIIFVWASGGFSKLFKTTDEVRAAAGPDDNTLDRIKCQRLCSEANSAGRDNIFCNEEIGNNKCPDIISCEGIICP